MKQRAIKENGHGLSRRSIKHEATESFASDLGSVIDKNALILRRP
jgi:hypothetical protein